MKKRRLPFQLFSGLLFAAIGQTASGQWQTLTGTGYLLPPTTRINVGTTTAAPSLLTVSGDQLANGETFRTISPGGTNNFWRMYKGNANEIGDLFSSGGVFPNALFNIASANGSLLFHTNSGTAGNIATRMRLNRTVSYSPLAGHYSGGC